MNLKLIFEKKKKKKLLVQQGSKFFCLVKSLNHFFFELIELETRNSELKVNLDFDNSINFCKKKKKGYHSPKGAQKKKKS